MEFDKAVEEIQARLVAIKTRWPRTAHAPMEVKSVMGELYGWVLMAQQFNHSRRGDERSGHVLGRAKECLDKLEEIARKEAAQEGLAE